MLLAACTADVRKPALEVPAVEGSVGPAPAHSEGVEAVVRRHYPSGLPYADIKRFGPDALPRLRAMLGNSAEREYWPNTVGAIGIIDGPGASDVLIDYIDASWDRVLQPDSYRAALTAVVALGYVANAGDTRAMGFIAEAARRSSEPAQHTDSLRLSRSIIGVQAILALGLSGRPEARPVLEEIMRGGDVATRERAAESLRALESVARLGLAEYLKR